MIDSYIILNRKTSLIIKTFLFNILLLIIFIIWGINTLYYQNFIKLHSKFLYYDSSFYLEVLVPVKEVNQIIKYDHLVIDDDIYIYKIYEIDSNIIYNNNVNYQKIYLEILNIDSTFLINGYTVDIKILTEKKKIIDYFKEWKGGTIWIK